MIPLEARLASDVEAVGAFYDRLTWPFDAEDLRAARPDATVLDAAWNLLRYAFVVGPIPQPRGTLLMEVGAQVLGAAGGYGRRAVWDLALGEVHPARYFQMAPLLLTVCDGDGDVFCDALLDALEGHDPDRADRALHLLRAGYGVRFRFPASSGQVALLSAAVEFARAHGTSHAGLAAALAAYIPPSVHPPA